jgi:hypothetical protein
MENAGVRQFVRRAGSDPKARQQDPRPALASDESGRRRGRMNAETVDEEAARRLIESIAQRIDSRTHVLLREPGRPERPNRLRLALIQQGHTYPFELTAGELREARSALGRERLARRLGATLGLQPPDQLTGPPRD